VGGVRNSQHLTGQAADIHLADPSRFRQLVEFLKTCKYTDQLLTGSTWLHVSWTPFDTPRHFIRIGYYK
jgi:putative chitinase